MASQFQEKENAAPQNGDGECGETPKPSDRACLEDTPTPVSKNLRPSQTSGSGLFEIFEECTTQSAGAAALESEAPQTPKSQFFEIFEDHVTPAAPLEAAAVEPALAEPVRVLRGLPQWGGEFRNKNTSIDDYFVDPPGPQRAKRHSEPRDFLRHTTQVTIEKTFLHSADPPANASQVSVNSEPRNVAPQVFIRNEAQPEPPMTPMTPINLYQALGAPSTSSRTIVHPGASYSTSPTFTSSPTSGYFFAMFIEIPPFPVASSRSSPSQPVPLLLAEHFPATSLP